MGDVLKFSSVFEYKIFEYALDLLFLSELMILAFTYLGSRRENKSSSDSGTIWLILFAWIGSIIISFEFRSKSAPYFLRNLLLPHFVYDIGLFLILSGIIIRVTAVWTLKHAFTHSVQTTVNQHLIQKGLYKYIRNPAYTGSILSLLGVAFAYRHILAPICVFIVCLICYGMRIKVEESALENRFQQEFTEYCRHTKYRLFPFVF